MRHRDPLTADMFMVPLAAKPLPGSHDYRPVVAHLVSEALRHATHDRHAIAADMSRLTGKDISKYMLDGYSAESREEFNLPLYLVPAFEAACGSHALTQWLAEVRGARLAIGREALTATLGHLQVQQEEIKTSIRELKKRLGEEA